MKSLSQESLMESQRQMSSHFPASEPAMWWHACRAEHALISVQQGEPCNWCYATEPGSAAGGEPMPGLLSRFTRQGALQRPGLSNP